MTDGRPPPGPTDGDARPLKRIRNEEVVADTTYLLQDKDFWFPDGSIILISVEGTGFRVHLSVLARNCEFFSDMLRLAKPANEDVQKLRLMDSAHDIKCFIHYFYDIGYFYPGKPTTCRCLAALFRMATKYICYGLRTSILFHISCIYPSDYKVLPSAKYISEGDEIYHPQLTINMLRENNAPELLPLVFYRACCAQSPNHASFLTSKLSAEDEHRLNIGRSHLARAVITTAWSHLHSVRFVGSEFCDDDVCLASRRQIFRKYFSGAYFAHAAFTRPMPHKLFTPPQNEDADLKEGEVCLECWRLWAEKETPAYQQVWESLHVYFDLPPPVVAGPT